jgi:hypothetical protein
MLQKMMLCWLFRKWFHRSASVYRTRWSLNVGGSVLLFACRVVLILISVTSTHTQSFYKQVLLKFMLALHCNNLCLQLIYL